MQIPELHEDRKYALKQWRAAWNIIDCKEKQITSLQGKVKSLEIELAKCSKTEIDALYAENERLTNLLEK